MLSERPLKKLQGIRICSKKGHKVKDLFQMVLNAPDLWKKAYGNIYNNKGGRTPGVDGLTLDGYSDERAANLRELLRENRYVPTPVKSHLRKLADIKEGKQPWEKLMMARKRITLVLCVECHQKLTNGSLPDRRHLLK